MCGYNPQSNGKLILLAYPEIELRNGSVRILNATVFPQVWDEVCNDVINQKIILKIDKTEQL